MPLTIETDHFFDEAVAVFDRAKGPVDSFVYNGEVKERLLNHAVATGEIDADSFADCPIFDKAEERKARFEAMRAKGILNTLEHMDPRHLDLAHRIELEVAQSQVDMFVVVESARQLQLIRTGQMESPYFEHARDEHGHARKGRGDFLREVLHEALDALYPEIDPVIVAYSLNLAAESLERLEDRELEGQAAEFMDGFNKKYGHIFESAGEAEPVELDQQKAAEMREELQRQFGPHFEALREEFGDISNDKIPAAANRLLERMGYAGKGWKAVENHDINGFKVVQQELELQCGKRKSEITWDNFEALMVHEVGKHMEGAVKGLESGFEPLRMGLPESAEAEEGISLLFEKIWKGERTFNTLDRDHFRYITVAYAQGKADGRPHTPDETFKFISQLMMADALAKKDSTGDEAFVKIQTAQRTAAFEHVFRTYRGMPPGEVMAKNASYLSGKLGMIKFANQSPMSGLSLVRYFQCGKIDPNKERDRQIVSEVWQLAA